MYDFITIDRKHYHLLVVYIKSGFTLMDAITENAPCTL
jgi:hypothetical protein